MEDDFYCDGLDCAYCLVIDCPYLKKEVNTPTNPKSKGT